MYKRLLCVFLVFAVLLLLAGCGSRNIGAISTDDIATFNTQADAEKKNELVVAAAKKYLKDNYPDDEFSYLGGTLPSWAYSEYTLVFSTKKYEDREFTVYAVTHDKNKYDMTKYEFYDTYFVYTVNDEAEKYFCDLFGECISEPFCVKLDYVENRGAAEYYQRDLDFYSNYKDDTLVFVVYIFIEDNVETVDNALENIVDEEDEKGLDLFLTRIIVDDLKSVDNNTVKNIKNHLGDYYSRRKDFQ